MQEAPIRLLNAVTVAVFPIVDVEPSPSQRQLRAELCG